jgi:hypothetical protein
VFYLRILIGKYSFSLFLNIFVLFSKNKPVLKDLIPEGHIDISHLFAGLMTVPEHLDAALRETLQGFGVTEISLHAYHSACLGQHP